MSEMMKRFPEEQASITGSFAHLLFLPPFLLFLNLHPTTLSPGEGPLSRSIPSCICMCTCACLHAHVAHAQSKYGMLGVWGRGRCAG